MTSFNRRLQTDVLIRAPPPNSLTLAHLDRETENLHVLVLKGGMGSCGAGVYEREIMERQEKEGY